MIKGKKVLAIIPARGGSKGVIKKNMRLLGGKPLIKWTLEAASESRYLDSIVVSSDDAEILDYVKTTKLAIAELRPLALAQDETPTMDVVLHVLSTYNDYDYVVLLQPTSPFRSASDIDSCLELSISNNFENCVSVVESDKNPYWMFYKNNHDIIERVINDKEIPLRRQDTKPVYLLNGAIYVATYLSILNIKSFIKNKTIAYVMNKYDSLDIDSEFDFAVASLIIQEKWVRL